MAEIWPKTLKNAQNLQNGLGLCAHRAFVYEDVFRVEIDSEPAARDLFATRFSAQSEKLAFSEIFEKPQFYGVEKPVFAHFLANRLTDFQKFFFA